MINLNFHIKKLFYYNCLKIFMIVIFTIIRYKFNILIIKIIFTDNFLSINKVLKLLN